MKLAFGVFAAPCLFILNKKHNTRLTSQEEIDLIINSRVALEGKVSDVSVDEMPGNCSQALEKINSDIPLPTDETSRMTESSPPIPHSDEALEPTAMVVASEFPPERTDEGPF